jgi:tRNA A37 N6-isopentenylltransferase MiaA
VKGVAGGGTDKRERWSSFYSILFSYFILLSCGSFFGLLFFFVFFFSLTFVLHVCVFIKVSKQLEPYFKSDDWHGAMDLLKKYDIKRNTHTNTHTMLTHASFVCSFQAFNFFTLAHTYIHAPGAESISINDWYRLGRALEIAYSKELAASSSSSESEEEENVENDEDKSTLHWLSKMKKSKNEYDFRCFFLCPSDRWALFEKIDERCEEMLIGCTLKEYHAKFIQPNEQQQQPPPQVEAAVTSPVQEKSNFLSYSNNMNDKVGLLEETSDLLSGGVMDQWSMAGRAIGYRQAIKYLLSQPSSTSSSTSETGGGGRESKSLLVQSDLDAFHEFLNEFRTATRNYATDQIKWFRKDEEFMFLSVEFMSRNPLESINKNKKPRNVGSGKSNGRGVMQQQQRILGDNTQDGGGVVSNRPSEGAGSRPRDLGSNNNNNNNMSPANRKKREEEAEERKRKRDYEMFESKARERKHHLLQLVLEMFRKQREEYNNELHSQQQLAIREEVLSQGSKMKAYASNRWLIKDDIDLLSKRQQKKLVIGKMYEDRRQKRKLVSSSADAGGGGGGNGSGDEDNEDDESHLSKVTLKEIVGRAHHCMMKLKTAGIVREDDPNVLFRHLMPRKKEEEDV